MKSYLGMRSAYMPEDELFYHTAAHIKIYKDWPWVYTEEEQNWNVGFSQALYIIAK